MPTTTRLGFRVPAGGDYPAAPSDFLRLANDIDAKLYNTGPAVTALAINAGWHAAVGFGAPSYYKDATGKICLAGTISNDNAIVNGSSNTAFTLPTGFRPANVIFQNVPVNMGTNGVSAQLQFNTNGTCVFVRTPVVNANLLWDLSQCSFHPGV